MSQTESTAYGMPQPTVAGTRAVLESVGGHGGTAQWDQLLATSGLNGRETDEASLERLLAVMTETGGVTAQCARAQRIRLVCHTNLSVVQELVRAAH
jgi:hypothetical protein